MMLGLLKCKLHGATVTDCSVEYEGSITIGRDLMDSVGLGVYEKVLVADITNGSRFETYVIEGVGSEIVVNGAAARLADVGDRVIIMSFGLYSQEEAKEHKPRVVRLGEGNTVMPR